MPDDGSDLSALERKIPHVNFVMSLFTDKDRKHQWALERVIRFHRVKAILLRCWENMKTFARQMAGNREFSKMFDELRSSVERIQTVENDIFSALQPRAGMRAMIS